MINACTPHQLNRDLGLILGRKPAGRGDTIVQAQLHPACVVVAIDHRAITAKGRREIIKTTRRVDMWTLENGVWAIKTTAEIDLGQTGVLSFYAQTATEQRDREAWSRLGGVLDRDGYRKPVSR